MAEVRWRGGRLLLCWGWAGYLLLGGLLPSAAGLAGRRLHEALGEERPGKLADFRQSMLLDVDAVAVKKLRTAEEHIRVRQWAEAVDQLRQVAEADGDKLVGAAPQRFLNVRSYCDLLV